MAQNALDYEAIRNTVALYCIALDTKDFSLFQDVFASTLDARYPFGGAFDDRDALANAIRKRLEPVTTQHALTTQSITIDEGASSASATTYFTGIHLGQGRWKGQIVTAYGRYDDRLECSPGSSKVVPGATGQWLITKRKVTFMGRVGEEGVMKGERE
ncbi:hypothetical protein AAFC00_003342 [Neodothiora populina]|uniref:SnoaL-like domain-containing protein n=1 Tax=Neodothiora populina TaxID=2781224 RepID=A0ABR3PA33_9PEZI